jgi:N-acetylmuramoyl-L-alanine amidase
MAAAESSQTVIENTMLKQIPPLFIILAFFMLPNQAGAESKYYQAAALSGDGIYSLLRRYQLDRHSCNFDHFYQLNGLKRNAHLIVGKKYSLPLLVYTFNGKTIRSSIGINDWNTAVRIQEYNEQMHELKLREESFKKDKVLWVPYHELNCPEQDMTPAVGDVAVAALPNAAPEEEKNAAGASSGNRKFPIFGPKYAYTPLTSNKLKGKVYYISSGHGGPDPGAIGRRSGHMLCEDEYAYDVALRLCRNLIAHGATAYMILRDPDDGIRDDEILACDKDEVVWGGAKIPHQQKARLTQRSDLINELYESNRKAGVVDQTAIMIHVDSRNTSERIDVFFYHQSHNEESKKLAQKMHQALRQKYKQYRPGGDYHGTVSPRELHMLRETTPKSVYIELANIRNTADQKRIILSSNRQYLADWLLEGLIP